MEKELLTTQEVADLFEVSKRTVQLWVKAGKLPVIKIGRTVRIKRDALLALEQAPKRDAA
jgi:excisionase family DNA binding protein